MARRIYRKYSPAIAEDLIRPLYLLGQRRRARMTTLASAAVREYLAQHAPDLLTAPTAQAAPAAAMVGAAPAHQPVSAPAPVLAHIPARW